LPRPAPPDVFVAGAAAPLSRDLPAHEGGRRLAARNPGQYPDAGPAASCASC